MDTSDSAPPPFRMPHTNKAGCPLCSGLCSRRSPPRSPPGYASGGAEPDFSVHRPTNCYTGVSEGYHGCRGSDIALVGSLSSKITNRDYRSASSYGGAGGTTGLGGAGGTTGLGAAGGITGLGGAGGNTGLGGARGTTGLGAASSSSYTCGDPGRAFMNGIGNTRSLKSSYEAGYEEGLRIGYELAYAEFYAQRVNAANGNGSEGRDLLSLKNGDASGGDDNGIGNGYEIHHHQNKSNYGSSAPEVALWTDTVGQTSQSNGRSSANGERVFDSKTDKETKLHTAGRTGENLASSFPPHRNCSAETEGNVLGLTKEDEATILFNAAKFLEYSDASSPTHSDHNDTKRFNSVRPKSRSTSYNGTAARKDKSPWSHSPDLIGKSSTRSVNKNTNDFDASRKGVNNLSLSPDFIGKGSTRSVNKNTNDFDASRKGVNNLSLSPDFIGKGSTRSVNKNTNELDALRKGVNNVYPSLEGLGAVTYPPLEGLGALTSGKQKKFRKKPASQQEKLLAEFTTEVFHQPLSSRVAATREVSASTSSGNNTAATPPACTICITSLAEDSPYLKSQDVSRDLVGCAALNRCGHHFHICCLKQMATHDASWLTCPNCQTIHGVRIGTQPKGGMMSFRKYGGNLPGFPRSSGTIEITYSFRHGNQGPEHPNPGRPYHLVGFPRVAYLPDTNQGNKVLKLLRVAFDRRLIFTVGTSATSGSTDCVVWNGVHHKTETHDSSGHGYPDPKYLENVIMELASFGVT